MRRPWIASVLSWWALSVAVLSCAALRAQEPAPGRPYLAWARDIDRWLRAMRVETEHGISWPVDPAGERHAVDLYSGTAGVVLFYLEAHHAIGEAEMLAEATRGADHIAAQLPDAGEAVDASLYTGVAGLGYTLHEVHEARGEQRFADAARRCVDLVIASAEPAGAGVEWNDVTDIIRGGAGMGAFLLYASRETGHEGALDTAAAAGRRLVELGQETEGGTKWMMSAVNPREYPNFSHGTAGVAWFLAQLHRATGEKEFLDAALAGARYLDEIADDGLVLHHRPGGEELFYLGWCHGPPGTARLYHVLSEITGDGAAWRARIDASCDALAATGIPKARPEGFWNNAGQCCGTAGVVEWILRLDRTPERERLLQRLADDITRRATRDDKGARWTLAEHRVRPDLLGAQTGYMQGAAGIGIALLHLDGAGRREPRIVLPDSPYRP